MWMHPLPEEVHKLDCLKMKVYTWERIGFYLCCFVCYSQSTTTAHCQVRANWHNVGLIHSGNSYLQCNQKYMFWLTVSQQLKLSHLKMSVVFITTLSTDPNKPLILLFLHQKFIQLHIFDFYTLILWSTCIKPRVIKSLLLSF